MLGEPLKINHLLVRVRDEELVQEVVCQHDLDLPLRRAKEILALLLEDQVPSETDRQTAALERSCLDRSQKERRRKCTMRAEHICVFRLCAAI